MYLNSVYFGEGATGIQAAAKTYFGEDAKDLDLAESALLAGLLTAPSKLSPLSGKKDLSYERQKYILDKMAQQKYITQIQATQAKTEKLKFNPTESGFNYQAPHFALMVKDELIKQYGEENISKSGFKVYTTLDLDWQAYSEKVVTTQVKNLAGDHVTNGAAVVIDPRNGEIRALVGSNNWYNNKFGKVNMATTPRQPGQVLNQLFI